MSSLLNRTALNKEALKTTWSKEHFLVAIDVQLMCTLTHFGQHTQSCWLPTNLLAKTRILWLRRCWPRNCATSRWLCRRLVWTSRLAVTVGSTFTSTWPGNNIARHHVLYLVSRRYSRHDVVIYYILHIKMCSKFTFSCRVGSLSATVLSD